MYKPGIDEQASIRTGKFLTNNSHPIVQKQITFADIIFNLFVEQ